MEINTLIIIYVFGIVGEIVFLFIKPRILLTLPIIASCIAFIILKDSNIFILALTQCLVGFVGALVFYAVDQLVLKKKRKNSKEEKTMIKDL